MPAIVYLLEHKGGKRYVGHTKQSLEKRLAGHWSDTRRAESTKQTKVRPLINFMRITKPDEWKARVLKEVPEDESPTDHEYRAMHEFRDDELLNVVRAVQSKDPDLNHEFWEECEVRKGEQQKREVEDTQKCVDTMMQSTELNDREKARLQEVHAIGRQIKTELKPAQLERIAYYYEANLAESTQRSYKGVLAAFTKYCRTEFPTLTDIYQCTGEQVVAFLVAEADAGLSTGTIELRLACLHKVFTHIPQEHWAQVHETVTGIKRRRAGDPRFVPHGKDALMATDLQACIATIDGNELVDVRNRCLLLVMWFSAMRRSEVATLHWRDVVYKDNGVLVRIVKSKTDQGGDSKTVGLMAKPSEPLRCPVLALMRWRDAVKPHLDDVVFPHINAYTGALSRELPMGVDRIYRLVKDTCAAAGLDPHRFAPHSFRSGVITQGATNGIALHLLQKQARHASISTTAGYIRDQELLGDASMTALL